MISFLIVFLSLLILFAAVASVAAWIFTFWKLSRRESVWPASGQQPSPVGLAEIFFAMGAYLLVSVILVSNFAPPSLADSAGEVVSNTSGSQLEPAVLQPDAEVPVAAPRDSLMPDLSVMDSESSTEAPAKQIDTLDRFIPMILINDVALIVGSIAAIAFISFQGYSFRSVGLLPDANAFKAGIFGIVWILPPTMALQAYLTTLFPYHHPLLDILKEPQSLQVILAMGLSSTLVAPLAEEFFFRGLFQGFLERVSRGRSQGGPAEIDVLPSAPRLWPMVAASLLFASVHFGQGPGPISLFFFSLGIGYLYRQTGSIWPGIIVHMALNGLSTLATMLGPGLEP